MKRAFTVIRFYRAYWPEVKKCAALTVELWGELFGLAGKLAGELRDTEAKQAGGQ